MMSLLLNSQSEGSIHVAAVMNDDWIMLSSVTVLTCVQYCDNLRSMYRSYSLSNKVNKHTNPHYLHSPQKVQRIKALWSAFRNKRRQLQRLRKKLELLTYKEWFDAPEDLWQDVEEVIRQHQPEIARLPNDDFKHTFWEQQVISEYSPFLVPILSQCAVYAL